VSADLCKNLRKDHKEIYVSCLMICDNEHLQILLFLKNRYWNNIQTDQIPFLLKEKNILVRFFVEVAVLENFSIPN